MTTATFATVSFEQYNALHTPLVLPTPQELFDYEIATLREKGFEVSAEDIERLRPLVPEKRQLILFVPPKPDSLDPAVFMTLVKVNGKIGKNYLDQQYLSDVVQTPKTAHLLLDVEDGRKRLYTKPSVSFQNITQEGRLAYTTWRGLVHGILFPYVFQHHNLDLVGSRYGSSFVPCLGLIDGIMGLFNSCGGNAYPKWGAPSAGSVVGA